MAADPSAVSLRSELHVLIDETRRCIDKDKLLQAYGKLDAMDALLRAVPPAAAETAVERYTRRDSEALAWREIASRSDEAHDYCHEQE